MEKSSGTPPMPGSSAFADSLEMMKRMWSFPTPGTPPSMMPGLGGSIPSMFLPTADVGEIDKRIADLRSVEQWLNLNATMLRTTIQSLEVQRNTLAALRAFGGTIFGANFPSSTAAPSPTEATPAPAAPSAPPPSPPSGSTAAKQRGRAKATANTTPAPPVAPLPFDPTQWWAALQDQFMRVAASAVADPPQSTPPATDPPPARKP